MVNVILKRLGWFIVKVKALKVLEHGELGMYDNFLKFWCSFWPKVPTSCVCVFIFDWGMGGGVKQ